MHAPSGWTKFASIRNWQFVDEIIGSGVLELTRGVYLTSEDDSMFVRSSSTCACFWIEFANVVFGVHAAATHHATVANQWGELSPNGGARTIEQIEDERRALCAAWMMMIWSEFATGVFMSHGEDVGSLVDNSIT